VTSEAVEPAPSGHEESLRTVLIALAVNLSVAMAKLGGGLLTGSAALLAEAAHSFADTLNELFLVAAVRRSSRPADRSHPFGYGKERFFWSLLAAVGIFTIGGAFSIYTGLHALRHGEDRNVTSAEWAVAWGVLAFSFVVESYSLSQAVSQIRGEARQAGRPVRTFIRTSPDPTVKTVLSEDIAALAGIALAAVATFLHQVYDAAWADGAASIAIGLLLVYVAYILGRDTKDLLIGEAADPSVRLSAYRVLSHHAAVSGVQELLTMQLGPDSVLVAARVDFDDRLGGRDIERAADEIEAGIRAEHPEVRQVFLDPTNVAREADRRARAIDLLQAEVDSLE
jgi:cation diffusion facilitator family transporter